MTPMKPRTPPLQSACWLDQLRERMRDLDYSLNTGTVYQYRLMTGASKRLLDAGQAEQAIRLAGGKVG